MTTRRSSSDSPTQASVEFVKPLDAGFLDLDRNPALVTHMGCLWVLEDEPTWSELLAAVNELVDRLPRLRARARSVPFRGYAWVEDPVFAVEHHVRQGEGEPGADLRAVLHAASAEFSDTLDRSKPLWDVTLYRRLAGGGSALFMRFHHALVDGVGLQRAVLGPPADRRPPAPDTEPALGMAVGLAAQAGWVRERAAWTGGAIARMATDSTFRSTAARQLAVHAAHLRTIARSRRVQMGPSHDRRLAVARLPLETFKAAAEARGGRINDLVVATALEATRRSLADAGSATRRLRATMPINLRSADDAQSANVFARALVEVAVDGRDVRDRLPEIAKIVQRARDVNAVPVGPFVGEMYTLVPAVARRRIHEAIMTFPDTLASNLTVPCPPMQFAGQEVREVYPLPPGIGVPTALSALTYGDHLQLGFTVHAGLVPDAARATEHFETLIAELTPTARTRQTRQAEQTPAT
jgi:WS/DGAT/MGAT family acyltransferase